MIQSLKASSFLSHLSCVLWKLKVKIFVHSEWLNQFTSGYYIFPGPPCGIIFSEKFFKNSSHFFLWMNRSPDNQINASFIDISRIKWLVFFIAVVFLRHNQYRCKLRSNGLLSTRTRSNRQHTWETSKTMDINPSLQIRGWYVKGTGRGERD